MSGTDYLRLSDHKIFKEVCESLPKKVAKTLNLLTVRDNVLFSWDFHNNCVLSLNVKAVRSKQGDAVIHQKLLPISPPLFTPEFLVANESGTILAVAGPSGVLVLRLPQKYPPYGCFDNNKEVVYCRSYSLDERLLCCSETLEVRQVRFHPGSPNDSHILVLTSDNTLWLYEIFENDAAKLGVYNIGEKPGGMFPGSKTPFLDLFGEIAVDFDFGQPEIADTRKTALKENQNIQENKENEKSLISAYTQTPTRIIPKQQTPKSLRKPQKTSRLIWPIYILRGDSSIFCIYIDLNEKNTPPLLGPLPVSNLSESSDQSEACSLICLHTWPQMLCIGMSNGLLVHSVLLDMEEGTYKELKSKAKIISEVPTKELIAVETIQLELGISTSDDVNLDETSSSYKCPVFLHKDESKNSRYFATHNGGVHSIDIFCVEGLQSFVNGPESESPTSDIFVNPSSVEYLVCTKTSTSEKFNPTIGFALYYDPTSIMTLLKDGSFISLSILPAVILPKLAEISLNENDSEEIIDSYSPLKKMLKEPFDEYIQKILKKACSQPVLKLSSSSSQHTTEECYELLQRSSQVLRDEYFKHHSKAREELEKRIYTLKMLKETQKKEIDRMILEKEQLRTTAENLAEKYEDIKDKQDELLKRCENLLMLVARKKTDPSDAEKKCLQQLNVFSAQSDGYQVAIEKIKNKSKYQQIQMENWKAQEKKKIASISEIQANTIKQNMRETSQKLTTMKQDVVEYKNRLNIK